MVYLPGDTFAMRQSQAAELKVKIDRADRLDDSQLADLRAEIKVKPPTLSPSLTPLFQVNTQEVVSLNRQ